MIEARPLRFLAPKRPVDSTGIPLIGDDDGGLAHRQLLRSVKERMDDPRFKFGGTTKDGRRVPPSKMSCADCIMLKLRNVRSFRSWDSLRDHLIGYHGEDPREVPE